MGIIEDDDFQPFPTSIPTPIVPPPQSKCVCMERGGRGKRERGTGGERGEGGCPYTMYMYMYMYIYMCIYVSKCGIESILIMYSLFPRDQ